MTKHTPEQDEHIHNECMDIIQNKMTNDEFNKWLCSWIEPCLIIDIVKSWDIDIKKQTVDEYHHNQIKDSINSNLSANGQPEQGSKEYHIGVFEEQGGYMPITAKTKKQAEKKAEDILAETGITHENCNITHRETNLT